MFSPENSTKYLKNTKTSQTLPKSRKEGNVACLILWGQYYPNTEMKQRYHKKDADHISKELRHKFSTYQQPKFSNIWKTSHTITTWDLFHICKECSTLKKKKKHHLQYQQAKEKKISSYKLTQ